MSIYKKHEPYQAYIADVSYFSGKLETYLRYKEIPFERVEMSASAGVKEIFENTGVRKVPGVKTADNLWLKDTTPMLDWFEKGYPAHSITPDDSVAAFVSKLVEDYCDEWCWRTAMYFRWRSADNAAYLGSRIGHEVFADWPLPPSVSGWIFKQRQRLTFLKGDGLTGDTEAVIKQQYFDLLESLTSLLKSQPFLLGNKPTLVDIAFMGPFYRHYFCDPVPAKIMRTDYPEVLEWVSRMWNAKSSNMPIAQELGDFSQPGWQFILKEIVQDYLPYLHKNAKNWSQGKKKFSHTTTKTTFKNIPVVHYRVYCLEQLCNLYQQLDADTKSGVDALLKPHGEFNLSSSVCSQLEGEFVLPLKPRLQRSGLMQRLEMFALGSPWDMKWRFQSKGSGKTFSPED